MAYELLPLSNGRLQVRCVPGDILHIAYNALDDAWTVEDDPVHRTFRTRGEAIDRARFLGNDPDFLQPRADA
jgi:hypothetical protein